MHSVNLPALHFSSFPSELTDVDGDLHFNVIMHDSPNLTSPLTWFFLLAVKYVPSVPFL